ncbi:MAG: AEC family transporter [Bacillus sp. (in: firmicutes)]
MSNFILSLNVVLPLFLLIALGYFLNLIKLFDNHSLTVINNVAFRVFLPVMLFYNIYSTELDGVLNVRLMAYGVIATLIVFCILFIIIPMIEKDNRKRGVMIQGIFRSNFIIFGLPITASIFGEQGLGVTSLLIAVIVPLFNALAVISLEVFDGGKIQFPKIIKGILTNPLIIASILGIIFLLSNIQLPFFFEKTVSDISKVATPLILIILGGYFQFTTIVGYVKPLLITITSKLVLVPAVFIPLGIYLGFRDAELVALITLFAAPTAVSSFTMAKQMNADSELSSHIVVIGSAFSIFTLFFWIFILKQYHFI